MRRGRWGLVIAGLALALILAVLLGTSIGTERIPFLDIARIIAGMVPGMEHLSGDLPYKWKLIVVEVRLPIVLMALFVGLGLAGSGASMQGLFRNPLVDPFIIGISAGGAFGTVLGQVIFNQMGWGSSLYPRMLLSFIFGFGTVFLAYSIARRGNRLPIANLLLGGIALSAFLTSATYFLIYFFVENPTEVIFSLMGTCGNSTWTELIWVAPVVVVGAIVLSFYGRDLNAFSAGEEGAKHLGVDVEKSKLIILAVAAMMTAITVPFVGIVGFVGLIIPHMLRRVVGPDHRILIPGSALLGGTFLILSDLASRALIDRIIPLGIVTGLLGGAFFIYLLIARRET